MEPAMLADIMQLVKTVDVEKMVQEVRDAGDAANLDSMIATVTKKMLGQMQSGSRDDAYVRVTLAEAFAGKRRRVRVRMSTGEHRDVACVVPPGCPDGHTLTVGPPDASVELTVRVAESEAGVRRDADGNVFTVLRVSLGETRALHCALRMPWGESVLLEELSDEPLIGWVCVKGAGMRNLEGLRADLYVLLDLEMPKTWASVGRLADVPPLNPLPPTGERRALSRPDEPALAKCKSIAAFDLEPCPRIPA